MALDTTQPDPFDPLGDLTNPYDPYDPYTGGTDPNNPPRHAPGSETGWWEFIDGVWRWMSMPLPGTIARTPGNELGG